MQQQEIHDFLITYFQANECEILENEPRLSYSSIND